MVITDPVILLCAIRYALGRSSYEVNHVVNETHLVWDTLSQFDKGQIVAEICEKRSKYGDRGLGMECYQHEWLSIVNRYEYENR